MTYYHTTYRLVGQNMHHNSSQSESSEEVGFDARTSSRGTSLNRRTGSYFAGHRESRPKPSSKLATRSAEVQ